MTGYGAANIISSLLGVFIFIWVIMIGIVVLVIVAEWKVFEKAGEPGWASLVPFYNSFVLYKISWGNGWYFLMTAVPGFIYQILYFAFYATLLGRMSYGGFYGNSFGNAFAMTGGFGLIAFSVLLSIAVCVITVITYVKLAKAFGQGGGFACGLVFLFPVFLCILAFSKDMVFVGIPGKAKPYTTKYCTSCGALIDGSAAFCPQCGNPQ